MVETNVIGFSKQKRLVEHTVKTVMDNLNLNVPLTVRKLKLKNEDTLAFAYDVMDSYGLCVFENCPPEKLQEVISHELIHIEQMVRGDLRFDIENQTFYWKGEMYDQERLNILSYYDRPWEAEAKKLEKSLL